MQRALAEGSQFLFPSVRIRREGEMALPPAQMTTNLPTDLRAVGMEDKWYTMHSFRVGAVASRNMDGTAMGIPMEYIWCKSTTVRHRYVGSVLAKRHSSRRTP